MNPPERAETVVRHRVSSALSVAEEYRTGVSLTDLSDLLPEAGPHSTEEIERWLREHPHYGAVVNGTAFGPGVLGSPPTIAARRVRGSVYQAAARTLVTHVLEPALPLVRCIGITGSTAYGEPSVGDDCDFLAVTRPGGLWPFLTLTFLRLRSTAARSIGGAPRWCFNYVVDERAARADYARPRGFLFAREALMTLPVYGTQYYSGLVGEAPWLATEAPRLFARWARGGLPEPSTPRPVAWPLRLLNAMLFPCVAAYLQFKSLVRNRQLRGAGRGDECFRTVTRIDRMALVTERFDRLSQTYAAGNLLNPE